jgi:hypothetical protein
MPSRVALVHLWLSGYTPMADTGEACLCHAALHCPLSMSHTLSTRRKRQLYPLHKNTSTTRKNVTDYTLNMDCVIQFFSDSFLSKIHTIKGVGFFCTHLMLSSCPEMKRQPSSVMATLATPRSSPLSASVHLWVRKSNTLRSMQEQHKESLKCVEHAQSQNEA